MADDNRIRNLKDMLKKWETMFNDSFKKWNETEQKLQ